MHASARISTLSITSPADLAAAIPSLLGFRPEHSLVIVYLSGDTVALTVRFDLPLTDDVTAHAADLVDTANATNTLAVLVAPHREVEEHRPGLNQLRERLESGGAPLRDALLVDGDRFWSLACDTLDCCPAEGTAVPQACAVEADGVMRGIPAPASSREDFLARFTHAPDPEITTGVIEAAQAHLAGPLRQQGERAWSALQRLCTAGPRGRIAVRLDRAIVWEALVDVRVRDYLILRITETADALPLVEQLTDLALASPDRYLARTAGTAAFVQYTHGRSLPAQALSELAGDDSLASLVRVAVNSALPPTHLRQGMHDIRDTVLERLEGSARPSA